jgi:lambda family phage minor tail protein L
VLCLSFDDMVGTTFIRRRTFEQYLDGQPTADPTAEFAPEVWFVDRKVSETPEVVEFELASVLDFRGLRLPGRQIIANQCTFVYRGDGCAYMGPPVADALDNPTSDPALDRCGKRLSSCRMRLWPDGILNYGAFPAAGLVRT